jgi:RNA polymerase sigma-70 factor (ECF subfamily)
MWSPRRKTARASRRELADAEDVAHDAYLRWVDIDGDNIESPAAYLTTITTRLAINRLKSARHRRETYPGPWLPEPVITEVSADPADDPIHRTLRSALSAAIHADKLDGFLKA